MSQDRACTMDITPSTDKQRDCIQVRRRLCPHCDQNVSLKTFKHHRRLYYDSISDRWLEKGDNLATSTSEMPADHDTPPTSFGEKSDDSSHCDAPSHHYYLHNPGE